MLYIALLIIASFRYRLSRVTADDASTIGIQVRNMSLIPVGTAAASATFTQISAMMHQCT